MNLRHTRWGNKGLQALQKHQKDDNHIKQAHQSQNGSAVDVQSSNLSSLSVGHGSALLRFYLSMSADPRQKGSYLRSVFLRCGGLIGAGYPGRALHLASISIIFNLLSPAQGAEGPVHNTFEERGFLENVSL